MEPRHTPSENAETHSTPSSQSIGNRRATMKMIRDAVLGMVIVYELDPARDDHATRTLVFETQGTRVRLESFPDDWRQLDNKDLIALLTQAKR